jgi:hypothetical protein
MEFERRRKEFKEKCQYVPPPYMPKPRTVQHLLTLYKDAEARVRQASRDVWAILNHLYEGRTPGNNPWEGRFSYCYNYGDAPEIPDGRPRTSVYKVIVYNFGWTSNDSNQTVRSWSRESYSDLSCGRFCADVLGERQSDETMHSLAQVTKAMAWCEKHNSDYVRQLDSRTFRENVLRRRLRIVYKELRAVVFNSLGIQDMESDYRRDTMSSEVPYLLERGTPPWIVVTLDTGEKLTIRDCKDLLIGDLSYHVDLPSREPMYGSFPDWSSALGRHKRKLESERLEKVLRARLAESMNGVQQNEED